VTRLAYAACATWTRRDHLARHHHPQVEPRCTCDPDDCPPLTQTATTPKES